MLQAVKTPEEAAMSENSQKEVPMQSVSLDIWDKKYRLKTKQGDHVDQNMDDSYSRVARALADVEEENKRLVSDFESTKNLLNAMVNAGELTKNDLLDLYIKKRTQSDYLKGRMHAAGKEHYGTQRIFEVISRATTPEVVAPFLGGHDKLVTDELVHAIARAISIGDMTAEEVFTNLDEKGKDPNQGVSRLRSV